MDVRKIETIKDGDKAIGSRHRVRIVKNKVSPPFRIAEFDIMANGISREGGLLDVALELGQVTKSGAFIKYNNQVIGQGREAAKAYLRENPKVTKELQDAVWKAAKTNRMPVEMGIEDKEE